MERFDAIVVGAGAVGTATARQLAMRGRTTLLLERFTIGHPHGSSGGPTRIFRYAYADVETVRLAIRARAAWDELMDTAGEELLRVTGGIDAGPLARLSAEALRAAGLPVEEPSVDEASERWPDLHFEPGTTLVYQSGAAVCRAELAVAAQARLAVRAGAQLRDNDPVASLALSDGSVRVTTSGGASFVADVAVVSAGAWAAPLLRTAGIDLPLIPSLEQCTYFRIQGAPSDLALPTLTDWTPDRRRVPYVVPDPFAPGDCKIGLHRSGPDLDPDNARPNPDADRIREVESYAAARLPRAGPTGRTDTCLYTNTPDEAFVLDRIGPLVVASPCSGHGFKFVPLVGAISADLATGREPDVSIDRFRADRFRRG
jgi:sarcosine oxidase